MLWARGMTKLIWMVFNIVCQIIAVTNFRQNFSILWQTNKVSRLSNTVAMKTVKASVESEATDVSRSPYNRLRPCRTTWSSTMNLYIHVHVHVHVHGTWPRIALELRRAMCFLCRCEELSYQALCIDLWNLATCYLCLKMESNYMIVLMQVIVTVQINISSSYNKCIFFTLHILFLCHLN